MGGAEMFVTLPAEMKFYGVTVEITTESCLYSEQIRQFRCAATSFFKGMEAGISSR
jgi:hypothetical protein